jgi:hypothetical protein
VRRSAGLLFALLVFAVPSIALAQEDAPLGRISGTIVQGTAGAALGEVEVRLLILESAQIAGDEVMHASDGHFEFEVSVNPERTYILTARYQGVQYLDFVAPIVLTPEQPEATREITVFEVTTETPDLEISETIVTVVAIDRGRGEIWLRREDVVHVPGDRVFAGDEAGITLRLPTPQATSEVSGGDLDGGVLSTSTVLFPGDENAIVTQYIVRYDPADDEYRLRVTAPVRTERMMLRVPAGLVRELRPIEEARRGDDIEAPELGEGVMQTVVLETPSEPGRGMLVDLRGLSGTRLSHPLTEQPGAGIAAVAALALISSAAVFGLRRRGGAEA